MLEFGRTVVSVRINNSLSTWESIALLMVVGNDQLHAALIDIFSFGNCGNTVINSDDKAYTVIPDLIYCIFIEAVALGAFGDVVNNIRTCFK